MGYYIYKVHKSKLHNFAIVVPALQRNNGFDYVNAKCQSRKGKVIETYDDIALIQQCNIHQSH